MIRDKIVTFRFKSIVIRTQRLQLEIVCDVPVARDPTGQSEDPVQIAQVVHDSLEPHDAVLDSHGDVIAEDVGILLHRRRHFRSHHSVRLPGCSHYDFVFRLPRRRRAERQG
jgi:hypothetical protein